MPKRNTYVRLLDKAKAAQTLDAPGAIARAADQELADHLFHERGNAPTGWFFPPRMTLGPDKR